MTEATTRRIDDAGEKIGGARKDWARERMLSSDVLGMTDEERVKHIQKDNVWRKPDYAALVAGGMSREAAALIKIIRDRMAKTPSISRQRPHATTLQWYFETLSLIGEHLERCNTLEEVKRAYKYLEREIAKPDDRPYYMDEGRWRFHSVTKGRNHPVHFDAWSDPSKVASLIAQGFPDEVPAWRRGHVVKKYVDRSDFILFKGKKVVKTGFVSEEAALDWLKSEWEAARRNKTSAPKKEIPERPHLDHIARQGLPDRRNGADISPQTFIDVFGFRAVEFGEWLPDDERQRVLNHGYDALMDLADAVGFAPGQISLDGTLAIAFGARGKSGAAAHYEPGRRVVNLTRISGAGALAHEWGHALDHMLGTGTAVRVEIPSVSGWRSRMDCRPVLAHRGSGVANAAFSLMLDINTRPRTKEEALERAITRMKAFEKSVSSYEKAIESQKKKAEDAGLKRVPASVNKLGKALAEQARSLEYWRGELASIEASGDCASFGRVPSNYYVEATKISGSDGYWARPNELFARAFESYVNDTISDGGGMSNYLVAWADERFYPEEFYKGNPYPSGEERRRLNEAWDGFMSLVAELVPDRAVSPPVNGKEYKDGFDPG